LKAWIAIFTRWSGSGDKPVVWVWIAKVKSGSGLR